MRSHAYQHAYQLVKQPGRYLARAAALFPAALLLLALGWAGSERADAQALTPSSAAQAKISSYLQDELAAASGPVEFLVILQDQPDAAQAAAQATAAAATGNALADAEARRVAVLSQVYTELTRQAQASQADLRAWLDAQGIAYRPFYLVNMIWVQGDAALAAELAARPEVARLAANPRVDSPQPPVEPAAAAQVIAAGADAPQVPYGVAYTRAPELWQQGFRGQGIVVAGQDTGVQWDHPALQTRYRGWNNGDVEHTYDWFDAWAADEGFDLCGLSDGPCDDNGHGTHTIGTILGADETTAYGMAPDATWIACRNMLFGFGTPASYTACFEFFLAPYPQDGDPMRDGRPDLAPHVINNSWGCPPEEGCDAESLRQVVETVRAAGQLVVSSAGNSGPFCSSVRDPIAIYDATFSIGAHDADGILAAFSSVGPVTRDGSGRLKPDLAAPGVGVLSTHLYSGTRSLSGTSMAAPHVTGAAALLWSAVPALIGNPDMTEQVLIKSAAPVLDNRCTDSAEGVWPNPAYGYGRLDVAAAVALAQAPWQVEVEVTDPAGEPVAGAAVVWVDLETGYRIDAQTSGDGMVRLEPVLAGRYALQVQVETDELDVEEIELASEAQDGELSDPAFSLRYRAQPENEPVPQRLYYFPWFPVGSGTPVE